jgi:transcription initiation factor TFIID TATA-box-binding protein
MRAQTRHRLGVVNVVCTMDVGRPINLMLSCMVTHGKLGMGVFPAHVSKCRFPPSTNCSFETGKLVNTGSVNCQSALLGATAFIDRLSDDLGYDLEIWNFEVQNIVGAVNLGFRINLDLFMHDQKHKLNCSWEPGVFPGLKHESSEPDIVFIMFKSGNVIATGPKRIHRMDVADNLLYDMNLERYEVGHEYRSLEDVRIIDVPRVATKKAKKPNQFKVINHTKKRAVFKANMLTASGKSTRAKRKTGPPSSGPPRKRAAATSASNLQYESMGDKA